MKTFNLLIIILLAFGIANAQSLKLNEAETKAFYDIYKLKTNLIIENDSAESAAKVFLEVLNINDKIIGQVERDQIIPPGKNTLEIPVFLESKSRVSELLWYRLRYTIISEKTSVTGIVSLSEIMPDLFELRASGSSEIFAGQNYVARVRAFHPVKLTPITNVKISAKLKVETGKSYNNNDDLEIKATGETDEAGFATLKFQIPADTRFSQDYWGGRIEIFGEKNGLEGNADNNLRTDNNNFGVFLTTDKPLYQPNQKIQIRGLALAKGSGKSKHKAAAEKDLEFLIKDEENTLLYRQNAKTSEFGIASIEWQIPDNAKLGVYKIEVKSDEKPQAGFKTFKVSRYELPNFIVKTKPDKEFYLPAEKMAKVTVDAVYLFGKPVEKGKVKIVRESERKWNYKEQKWDIEEEETYEGETDGEGKYIAEIDLSKTQDELKDEDAKQFEDLTFTAYFTDSADNKTEERRFDVRVTKEPIHVYVIGFDNYGDEDQHPKLPLDFYVTTSSASGDPVSCNVEIKGKYYDEDDDKKPKTLAKVKTNSFGAAKVKFSVPKRADNDYDGEDLELKITARDSENRVGTLEKEIEIDEDEKQIKVLTDKAIYKKGEPVKIEILSSEQSETVFVDVLKGWSSLESKQIKLRNGRGKLEIPFQPEFKSDLTVAVYFENEGEAVKDTKGIIYPTPQNLKMDVKSDKETFRPNEEASLDFAVYSPDKTRAENALGIVILDKAVEERAKTDSNFGGAVDVFSDYRSFLGFRRSFGGLTQNDLEENGIENYSKDMQLAAEVMFADSYFDPNFFSGNYNKNLQYVFAEQIKEQFKFVGKALDFRYKNTFEYPADEESLKRILYQNSIDFDALRDPWGNKYRAVFTTDRDYKRVYIWSNGANKVSDSENPNVKEDDYLVFQTGFRYFTPTGLKINKAIESHHAKTGEFIRDVEKLREILATEADIDLDELKDAWGEPYHVEFGVQGRNYAIYFRSSNSDKKFDNSYDDFVIWTNLTDYFSKTERQIEEILNKYIQEKKTFPKDETELKKVLKANGVDFDSLRDGWDRPLYIESEIVSRFADKVEIESVAKYGELPKESLVITPVTQELATFRIRSLGEKGEKNSAYWENPIFSTFAGIVSEQAKDDGKKRVVVPKTVFTNGKAAIYGVVTDANEAIIPGVEIKITNLETNAVYEIKTDSDGVYLKTNLPAGRYSVRADATGFKSLVITDVRVGAEKLVQTNMTLEVGSISEVVTVISGGVVSIDASSTKIDTNISRQQISDLPINGRNFSSLLMIAPGVSPQALGAGFQIDGASGSETTFVVDGQEITNFRSGQINEENGLPEKPQKETPRLRNYFPETLLWVPELLTDTDGKAKLKFRLADNITTWKIYAIASNKDGEIGVANKEIKAFQPFFVDLAPPQILTKDDEIFLPVQVRNYTKEKQKVDVEMAKADWFSFIKSEPQVTKVSTKETNSETQQIEVNANSTSNAVFGFRADKVTDEGLQKVTAIAENESDAIEKPVRVEPNGKEIVKTDSKIFRENVSFDVDFPANALPNSQELELKIYPNLFAHVAESVEGLLKRPYGCGEQTISSTYPNLMVLKFTKKENPLRPLAQKFLQKGYERLLGYQVASGGFSYWGGNDKANIALTAYAIRFLSDAGGLIYVDEESINKARNWLISQQKENGSWTTQYDWENAEDKRRTWQITTYVTRSLAMTERGKQEVSNETKDSLNKAFAYLKKRNAEINEPYALANSGLALLDLDEAEKAEKIAEKLQVMAITEGNTVYWKLETNTPFYGWGTAGRVETTALVVQFLTKFYRRDAETQKKGDENNLISKGTMFLLKNKDQYGVWYSTQATINVLDAILATVDGNSGSGKDKKQIAEIFVNGEKVKDVELPPANELAFPMSVRISSLLTLLNNQVEVKVSEDQATMAQVVQTHYISWQDFTANGVDINQSRQIRLDYGCDKYKATPTEEISCDVKAERVGFRGYGMLLAEIGLPPGADVDRASLEKAKKDDWSLSRYDVLPDRIIVYMWARPGGTNFNFKFKPRYAINAQTAPSVIYDYYNSEAKATVAPMRFEVR